MIGLIENILFTAGDAVSIPVIAENIGVDQAELESLIDEEIERRKHSSGLLIKRFEGSIQMFTRSEYAFLLSSMFGVRNEEELSKAMLETLSIVAYKQPVTRLEIEEIRGVNTSYTLNVLLEKGLVCECGRKESLGRPILYGTTEGFLRHFGIASTKELPEIGEGEKEEAEEE